MQVNVTGKHTGDQTIPNKTFSIRMINDTDPANIIVLCTASFEGSVSVNQPEWATIGCTWTGILHDEDKIRV